MMRVVPPHNYYAGKRPRNRKRPLRKYIYRDPDTGQEFMCWRGEALDRVIQSMRPQISFWRMIGIEDWISEWSVALVGDVWRQTVRLREPLANP